MRDGENDSDEERKIECVRQRIKGKEIMKEKKHEREKDMRLRKVDRGRRRKIPRHGHRGPNKLDKVIISEIKSIVD